MSVRVFNKKWTRQLQAGDNIKDVFILKPYAFADVPERFTGDITFKMGVKAGDIEVFETKKQGEAIEAKAFTEPVAAEAEAKPAKAGKAKKGKEAE